VTGSSLRTRYLGLDLSGPIIASASPLTSRVASLRELQDAGVSAVVLPSLFAEDAEVGDGEFHRLLTLLDQARNELTIPVLASVNAVHPGAWQDQAAALVAAGADAVELNVYRVAADPADDCCGILDDTAELVAGLRGRLGVPLTVKLTPYWTSLPQTSRRLVDAGAAGLVLFNSFRAPEIDLDELRLTPRVVATTSEDLGLSLRWVGILRPLLKSTSLAVTGGVHTGTDVLKAVIMGADVACTASALLEHGPGHVRRMLADVAEWLSENDYDNLDQLRGLMSAEHTPFPAANERAHYRANITSQG
jgi:dihydroorotate dehydrogenase (fumarate)